MSRCRDIRWGEVCGRCDACLTRAHWARVEEKLDAILAAIAMEARQGQDAEERLGAEHDSAAPKGIAQ